jgi:MtN3 and saliva related transmembrane protein
LARPVTAGPTSSGRAGLRGVAVMIFAALPLVVGFVMPWPQIWGLFRTRDARGLSPLAWTVSTVVVAGWTAYAVLIVDGPVLVSSASATANYALVCLLMARAGAPFGRALAVGAAFGATVTASAGLGAVFGPGAATAIGAVLAGSVVVTSTSAVVAAWGSAGTSGISPRAWALRLTMNTLWLAYGVTIAAWPMVLGNAIAVAAELGVGAAVARHAHRQAAAAAHLGPTRPARTPSSAGPVPARPTGHLATSTAPTACGGRHPESSLLCRLRFGGPRCNCPSRPTEAHRPRHQRLIEACRAGLGLGANNGGTGRQRRRPVPHPRQERIGMTLSRRKPPELHDIRPGRAPRTHPDALRPRTRQQHRGAVTGATATPEQGR